MAIFKKNGRVWIGYRGADGKRHRESLGVGASVALAKEVLAKRLAAAAEKKHFPGRVAQQTPFRDVAEKFWELHGQHLRAKGWRQMLDAIIKAFGDKKIGQITVGDVQRLHNSIAARGRPGSPSTANRYLGVLSSVFNKAKDWGDFYGDNPCLAIKKLREPAHRVRYLTREEMARLLAVAHPRLRPILACALMTGMRRGEILGLRWENVDARAEALHILESKSGRPRVVPMLPQLKSVLESIGPRASGRVFQIPVISVRRYFAQALRAAGVEKFRFHDLRHTFASHFAMTTGNLTVLQNILGHSTPAMTMRYAHLSRAHLASEMARFQAGMALPEPTRLLEGVSPTTLEVLQTAAAPLS
jgi:integrase